MTGFGPVAGIDDVSGASSSTKRCPPSSLGTGTCDRGGTTSFSSSSPTTSSNVEATAAESGNNNKEERKAVAASAVLISRQSSPTTSTITSSSSPSSSSTSTMSTSVGTQTSLEITGDRKETLVAGTTSKTATTFFSPRSASAAVALSNISRHQHQQAPTATTTATTSNGRMYHNHINHNSPTDELLLQAAFEPPRHVSEEPSTSTNKTPETAEAPQTKTNAYLHGKKVPGDEEKKKKYMDDNERKEKSEVGREGRPSYPSTLSDSSASSTAGGVPPSRHLPPPEAWQHQQQHQYRSSSNQNYNNPHNQQLHKRSPPTEQPYYYHHHHHHNSNTWQTPHQHQQRDQQLYSQLPPPHHHHHPRHTSRPHQQYHNSSSRHYTKTGADTSGNMMPPPPLPPHYYHQHHNRSHRGHHHHTRDYYYHYHHQPPPPLPSLPPLPSTGSGSSSSSSSSSSSHRSIRNASGCSTSSGSGDRSQKMMMNTAVHSNSTRRPHPNASFVTPTPKKLRIETSPIEQLQQQQHITQEFSATTFTTRQEVEGVTTAGINNGPSSNESASYSRKKKSLGVLAETFCGLYSSKPCGTPIVIDELACDLGVERRRIYDVVNVLESIQLVQKKQKNTYCWMGSQHLPQMFALLQQEAMWEHVDDAVQNGLLPTKPSPETVEKMKRSLPEKDCKSLSRLSRHFVQVFLVSNNNVSLVEASDKIHGRTSPTELAALACRNDQDNNTEDVVNDPKRLAKAAARGLKTKIRRLYDIANIFLSIGILAKTDDRVMVSEPQGQQQQKRPRYQWAFDVPVREILRVFRNMPDYMKIERCPFPNGRRGGAAIAVAAADVAIENSSAYLPPQQQLPSPPITLTEGTAEGPSATSSPRYVSANPTAANTTLENNIDQWGSGCSRNSIGFRSTKNNTEEAAVVEHATAVGLVDHGDYEYEHYPTQQQQQQGPRRVSFPPPSEKQEATTDGSKSKELML